MKHFKKCDCFVKSYRGAFTFDVDLAGYILEIKDNAQYYCIRAKLYRKLSQKLLFLRKKAHF